ncbi:hypothetical protein [Nocardioides sp. R-C-SC26]|uniref:hypothetical protein n=1 Tax=Nocardioides sp. R-C-SC26 TaxID=2870414 RepID=UPI001E43CDA6|nr:hypothetical protein [Nocardioides sp. R-C-SC26]
MASAADKTVAQSSAKALELAIAGTGADTGTITATRVNNGSDEGKETITGASNPPIAVLGNQNLLNVGVLAQSAATTVDKNGTKRDGISAACSGIAGDGGTAGAVAQVGESARITPGKPVGVSIANLDLTGSILIDPKSALGPLSALQPIMDLLVGPLTQAISNGLAPLGETGIQGTLGAVQAKCTARPGSAEGTANIVDSALTLSLAGTSVELVKLPANPPPNTHVITDLDVVLNTVLDAVEVNLNETLMGALAPLSAIIQPIQDTIVKMLIAPLADALAPLEDNILDITLNKQVKSQNGAAIEVTALDLQVLPAAQAFIGASFLSGEIGQVTCGPNASFRVGEPENPDPGPGPGPNPDPTEPPAVVDSGVDGGMGNPLLWGIAGVTLASAAAGFGGRRMLALKK